MKENVTGSLEWSGWIKEVAELVIHESAEDYLESILILQEQRGEVHSIDIVNRLGYSKPSVSIAMKKLRENGYISMAPDGAITLNDSGLEIASRVYTRHKEMCIRDRPITPRKWCWTPGSGFAACLDGTDRRV